MISCTKINSSPVSDYAANKRIFFIIHMDMWSGTFGCARGDYLPLFVFKMPRMNNPEAILCVNHAMGLTSRMT